MLKLLKFCSVVSVAFWLGSSSAWADLVVTTANLTGPNAGVGSFEVLVSNTNAAGGDSYDVASFTFELAVAPGVHFTSAGTATASHPYLFDGVGLGSVDPGFTLSLDTFPNTSLSGTDLAWLVLSVSVAPGDTFGLGFIEYSIDPGTAAGDYAISFVESGTSFTDPDEGAILFRIEPGDSLITVTAVPEPSSLALILSALGSLGLSRRWKRRGTSALAK